eukprot:142507_1
MSMDIILNVSILMLFIVKLRELIKTITINDVTSNTLLGSSISQRNDSLGSISLLYDQTALDVQKKRKDRLLTVVTRHTILSCIAIICDQGFYAMTIIYYLYTYSDKSVDIGYIARSIEGSIIALVLYLNFSFSARLYGICCRICHAGCYRCFVIYTKVSRKDIAKYNAVTPKNWKRNTYIPDVTNQDQNVSMQQSAVFKDANQTI